MNRNWLLAMFMLEVWHPAKTAGMYNSKYQALNYKARGIVLHDRALNDKELK